MGAVQNLLSCGGAFGGLSVAEHIRVLCQLQVFVRQKRRHAELCGRWEHSLHGGDSRITLGFAQKLAGEIDGDFIPQCIGNDDKHAASGRGDGRNEAPVKIGLLRELGKPGIFLQLLPNEARPLTAERCEKPVLI